MAGVAGRSGRRAETPFRDALRLALQRREADKSRSLIALANTLIDKASEGDMTALKEIADRLDGKAPQGVNLEAGEQLSKLLVQWNK